METYFWKRGHSCYIKPLEITSIPWRFGEWPGCSHLWVCYKICKMMKNFIASDMPHVVLAIHLESHFASICMHLVVVFWMSIYMYVLVAAFHSLELAVLRFKFSIVLSHSYKIPHVSCSIHLQNEFKYLTFKECVEYPV